MVPGVPDAPDWIPVGNTVNTEYRAKRGAPDILIVLPEKGLRDDGPSARTNMEFQTRYSEGVGRPCAVIVLIGALMAQDSEARRVYAAGMQPERFYAAALVVTSALSRAIGSFFLGLSRPSVPTKMFPDFDKAIAWAESQRP